MLFTRLILLFGVSGMTHSNHGWFKPPFTHPFNEEFLEDFKICPIKESSKS